MTEHRGSPWGPLPPEIVGKSLSSREPIFRLNDVRQALDHLHSAGYGVVGWEGIVRYPDGSYGHPGPHVLGTESIDRKRDEAWDNYVERSVAFCRRTIEQSASDWDNQSDRELCYAITVAPPPSTTTGSAAMTPGG